MEHHTDAEPILEEAIGIGERTVELGGDRRLSSAFVAALTAGGLHAGARFRRRPSAIPVIDAAPSPPDVEPVLVSIWAQLGKLVASILQAFRRAA